MSHNVQDVFPWTIQYGLHSSLCELLKQKLGKLNNKPKITQLVKTHILRVCLSFHPCPQLRLFAECKGRKFCYLGSKKAAKFLWENKIDSHYQ